MPIAVFFYYAEYRYARCLGANLSTTMSFMSGADGKKSVFKKLIVAVSSSNESILR